MDRAVVKKLKLNYINNNNIINKIITVLANPSQPHIFLCNAKKYLDILYRLPIMCPTSAAEQPYNNLTLIQEEFIPWRRKNLQNK